MSSTFTRADLQALASLMGGGAAAAIWHMLDGRPADFLFGAEEIAAGVGIFFPPAASLAQALRLLTILYPIVTANARPIQPRDAAYDAPEGSTWGM